MDGTSASGFSRPPRPEGRSLIALFSDLWRETSTLVHKEAELAKAEMSEKVSQVGSGLAESPLVLWTDNDLLIGPHFIERAARELCDRRLDYLVPYTSVRYLSEPDSRTVMVRRWAKSEKRPNDSGSRSIKCVMTSIARTISRSWSISPRFPLPS